MKIYLATGNLNKKRELQEILQNHTIVIPLDENIEFDPIENGNTFYENSIIKAKALFEIVHCPVIADDSGITVDILGDIPGIYSSRYAGKDFPCGRPDKKEITQEEKNALLIQQLDEKLETFTQVSKNPRAAHYTCAMVFYAGCDRLFIAEETMNGVIVDKIEDARGNGGFGYDPIFFLPQYNKTVAELTPDEKNAISHRGKAVRALCHLIENF